MSQFCDELFSPFPQISISSTNKGLCIQIETKNVYIRSYRDEDSKDCFILYKNPIITRYFDCGRPKTEKEIETLIQERGLKYSASGIPFGLFSLFYNKDGCFMGQADLFPAGDPDTLEFGCILHKQKSFSYSFVCRYLAMLFPFALPVGQYMKYFLGVALGIVALVWVGLGMKNKKLPQVTP